MHGVQVQHFFRQVVDNRLTLSRQVCATNVATRRLGLSISGCSTPTQAVFPTSLCLHLSLSLCSSLLFLPEFAMRRETKWEDIGVAPYVNPFLSQLLHVAFGTPDEFMPSMA